jgi:protein SCO1/2
MGVIGGVRSSNWNFLTGDEYIFDLANKVLIFMQENSKVDGGFEHSGFFCFIDKR